MPVPWGGQWKLKIAVSGDRTCDATTLQAPPQVVLVSVARAIPRRAVGVAAARHLGAVGELDDPPLEKLDVRIADQGLVDLGRVVVPGVDVARDSGGRETLLGERRPTPYPLEDESDKELTPRAGIVRQSRRLVRIAPVRVVAQVRDLLLECVGLVTGRDVDVAADEPGA